MAELPDRVLLYGVTGSGKSTAALAVGARTGHPVTLVDDLTWLPGPPRPAGPRCCSSDAPRDLEAWLATL